MPPSIKILRWAFVTSTHRRVFRNAIARFGAGRLQARPESARLQ